MVEQQIRTWEVLDQRVLDLLFKVQREEFVPPQYRALAFVDMEIPIGHGEKMLAAEDGSAHAAGARAAAGRPDTRGRAPAAAT